MLMIKNEGNKNSQHNQQIDRKGEEEKILTLVKRIASGAEVKSSEIYL